MIKVSSRAHRSEDRAGDPLDGLVNMFDIGIVLSLGFLLAALSALKLSSALTEDGLSRKDAISVDQNAQVKPVPADGKKVIGNGAEVGKVYKLSDGSLVYVVDPTPSAGASPSATPSP
ncbi:MAG: hypothetical protein JWO46_1187 [Nocardioidaceae bacterium]|nr:hypothetical protein [Nocardioidaceae bacterium]